MSNSNLEFITVWNGIFAFKIVENDLSKPNEKFVYNALLSYLAQFNIHILQLSDAEGGDVNFKIKFCSYIDHFYKLSDESKSFLYYDLTHPSPKKTAHMLKYLLNYWLYYNMVKEEVVNSAQTKIKQYQELVEKKQNLLSENEKLLIKLKMVEKGIEEYSTRLPKLNVKIENLKTTENLQLEKIKELSEKCKNFECMLSQLKHTETKLKSEIVSKDEVDNLRTNEESLVKALSEQEEVENVALANNQARCSAINKLQPTIKRIESTIDMYPVVDLLSAKQIKSKWKELMRQSSLQASTNEKKAAEIKTFSNKEDHLKKVVNNMLKLFNNMINDMKQERKEKEKNVELENKINDSLNKKLEEQSEQITSTKENREFMLQITDKIFQHICSNN